MPKHLQVKLLRFLEKRKFQRLGDVSLLQADVRIIAATNRKDISLENNTLLRSDLSYRLSEFEIHLPRLIEHGEDIPLLADKIIKRNRIKFSLPKLKFSSRARRGTIQYSEFRKQESEGKRQNSLPVARKFNKISNCLRLNTPLPINKSPPAGGWGRSD